jgi:hypothetical protein
MKVYHPEHLQVAPTENLTFRSISRCVEPAQSREFNINKASVEDWDGFPYLEHVENIADSVPQSLPSLPRTDTYPGPGALLIDFIGDQSQHHTQCCNETNLQHNPYYLFVTREVYKYIVCGIKKMGIKMYYDNVLKDENTTLHFPIAKIRDGVRGLGATMAADLVLGEWELHTLRI